MFAMQVLFVVVAVVGVIALGAVAFLLWRNASLRTALRNEQSQSEAQVEELNGRLVAQSERMNREHAAEIESMEKRHALQIQAINEAIDVRRSELSQQSDRELLIRIMLALDGYASRLQRVEDGLGYEQIKHVVAEMRDDVDNQLATFSTSVVGQVHSLRCSIVDGLHGIDVADNIMAIREGMSDLEDAASLMDSRIGSIETYVNEMKDALDYGSRIESIEDRLSDIDSSVGSIESDVDAIRRSVGDEYDYDSLRHSISEIKTNVDDIRRSMSDEYDYNSLRYALSGIESSVDSAKSAAEDAKSAAEEARDAAESVKYSIS